jgi:predicted RNase H-like nuclease (RuvC/YqgF family)
MSTQRQKEIETLRSRLARLEEEQQREQKEREVLESAYGQLLSQLESEGIAFDAFVNFCSRDIKKALTKIERKTGKETAVEPKPVRKKSAKKSAAKGKTKPKITVKIPAGRYTNIPPDKIFDVKEKGPRPKLLKAHAEKIGLEAFLRECIAEKA